MGNVRQLEQVLASLVHAKRDSLLGTLLGIGTFTGV